MMARDGALRADRVKISLRLLVQLWWHSFGPLRALKCGPFDAHHSTKCAHAVNVAVVPTDRTAWVWLAPSIFDFCASAYFCVSHVCCCQGTWLPSWRSARGWTSSSRSSSRPRAEESRRYRNQNKTISDAVFCFNLQVWTAFFLC